MSKPSRESGHNPRAITLETSKCQLEERREPVHIFFHASQVQLMRGGRGDDLSKGCHWEEDTEPTDVRGQVAAHQGPSHSWMLGTICGSYFLSHLTWEKYTSSNGKQQKEPITSSRVALLLVSFSCFLLLFNNLPQIGKIRGLTYMLFNDIVKLRYF